MPICPGLIRFASSTLCYAYGSLCLFAQPPPRSHSDPAGVFEKLTVARLAGSGTDSIAAMATDRDGNLYVAGSTTSLDLPMKNAAQPQFGGASILHSTDGGVTWSKAGNPPIGFPNSIAVSPAAPNLLFVGGDQGIARSMDGGATWTLVYAMTSYVGSIAVDPGNPARVLASVSVGIIASSDNGDHWTTVKPLSNGGHLWFDPSGSGTVVAIGLLDFFYYISRDSGNTWTDVRPPAVGPQAIAFDSHRPGVLYLGTAAGTSGSVLMSTDWGATWIARSSPPSNYPAIVDLLVDPATPDTVYAMTLGGLFKSTDAAASWQASLAPAFLEYGKLVALPPACFAGGSLLLVAGSAYASSDSGASWTDAHLSLARNATAAPNCSVYALMPIQPDAFIAKFGHNGDLLWSTYLGGLGPDTATAIAVDSEENVYVAGTTGPSDFTPGSARFGLRGMTNAFAAKFRADGTLVYADVLGGENIDTVSSIAADGQGNTFLVGHTVSSSFPVTPGAFNTHFNGNADGFIVKLGADGALLYASFIGGDFNFANAVAANDRGEAIVAGWGTIAGVAPPANNDPSPGYLIIVEPSGSRVTYATYFPGAVSGLKTDLQGNIYLTGQTAYLTGQTAASDFPVTPGAYVSPVRSRVCGTGDRHIPSLSPVDIFVMKLTAGDLSTVYSTVLGAPCASQSGDLQIAADGSVTISLRAIDDFPVRAPVAAGPLCPLPFFFTPLNGVVTRLTADASSLVFSSYLDTCGAAPVIAVAPDGSMYAGVTQNNHVVVLQLPAAPQIVIDTVVNAFSGMGAGIAPGSLLAITGANLSDAPGNDLGLNASDALPYALSGTQVLFDGSPAPILAASPSQVICVAPLGIKLRTVVQVVRGANASNEVVMPVMDAVAGLLTQTYPGVPAPASAVDGNVRNEDGTLNDADHPALVGSTVTLFATGLGLTKTPIDPGAPATTDAVVPLLFAQVSWNGSPAAALVARTLPGFVNALFQVRVRVPPTSAAGEVLRVPVALLLATPWPYGAQTPTNAAFVYVLQP
jgi:uncharacterized protein (TIGR03437 family)